MRLINRLRKLSLKSEITDEKEFMRVMLDKANERLDLKSQAYLAYVVYDYAEYNEDDHRIYDSTGGSILHLEHYPCSMKGITEIYEKLNIYKEVVIKNIILLEE